MNTIKRHLVTISFVVLLTLLSGAMTLVFANSGASVDDKDDYRCPGCNHVERAAKSLS
jgi:hypothetical protein